jgi:dihydrofolate reductase
MKLIMAVSKDGYVARGENDDMAWTGPDDKTVFKLLTHVGGLPLGVGRKTFEMIPKLPGRSLVSLSMDPTKGCTFTSFYDQYPDAWLIGGQTIAMQAIEREMVDQVFLCRSPQVLGRGVKIDWRLSQFSHLSSLIKFGDVVVEVRQ